MFDDLVKLMPAKSIAELNDALNYTPSGIEGPRDPEDFLPDFPGVMRGRGSYFIMPGEEYGDEYSDRKNDGDTAIIAIHARQGGGNDECYCDYEYDDDSNQLHDDYCLWWNNMCIRDSTGYITDEYDEFDSTYITFYFHSYATPDDVEKARQASVARSDDNYAKSVQDMVKVPGITPWAALSLVDYPFTNKLSKAELSQLEQVFENGKVLKKAIGTVRSNKDFNKVLDAADVILELTGDSRLERYINTAREVEVSQTKVDAARKEFDALPDDSAIKAIYAEFPVPLGMGKLKDDVHTVRNWCETLDRPNSSIRRTLYDTDSAKRKLDDSTAKSAWARGWSKDMGPQPKPSRRWVKDFEDSRPDGE